jgi:hypothetical protein
VNEVLWIRAQTVLHHILTPTLPLRGPRTCSFRRVLPRCSSRIADAQLIEFAGAEHGFAVPGDGRFLESQTRELPVPWLGQLPLRRRLRLRQQAGPR